MRRSRPIGFLALVLTTAPCHVAFAQTPSTSAPQSPGEYLHDGFYLRYALGGAFWRVAGDGPPSSFDSSGGGAGEILAIGGTLPGAWVIGGAASAVVSSNAVVGNYGPFVDWFPDPRGRFHLGGLMGLGLVASLGDHHLTGFAFGATLLTGLDFWLTPQFSMGIDVIGVATTSAPTREVPGYTLTPQWAGLLLSVLYH